MVNPLSAAHSRCACLDVIAEPKTEPVRPTGSVVPERAPVGAPQLPFHAAQAHRQAPVTSGCWSVPTVVHEISEATPSHTSFTTITGPDFSAGLHDAGMALEDATCVAELFTKILDGPSADLSDASGGRPSRTRGSVTRTQTWCRTTPLDAPSLPWRSRRLPSVHNEDREVPPRTPRARR